LNALFQGKGSAKQQFFTLSHCLHQHLPESFPRKPDGTPVESFTIITTEPNELVRPIHNRMPVILQPEDEEQWLDVSRTSFAKGQIGVEAVSRRADGCPRRFAHRQLSEVRRT
jgi:SOS response associated peptidase (SRAP)